MKDVCDMCGNDRSPEQTVCPFCGVRHETELISGPDCPIHKMINIEYGRPVVEDALKKPGREIEQARMEGVAVLTVIHGYGSSGKGGIIRQECRKTLEYMESKGEIRNYITGENFSKKNGATRSLLRRFPLLISNDNLNRGNRGVTLVLVK